MEQLAKLWACTSDLSVPTRTTSPSRNNRCRHPARGLVLPADYNGPSQNASIGVIDNGGTPSSLMKVASVFRTQLTESWCRDGEKRHVERSKHHGLCGVRINRRVVSVVFQYIGPDRGNNVKVLRYINKISRPEIPAKVYKNHTNRYL